MLFCKHSPPLLLATCKIMDHLKCSSNLPMYCRGMSIVHLIRQNKMLRLSQVIPLWRYLTAEERKVVRMLVLPNKLILGFWRLASG